MVPEVNYEPAPWGVPESPLPCLFGNCYGEGVPDNDSGSEGSTYVNTSNNDFYVKSNGVWELKA